MEAEPEVLAETLAEAETLALCGTLVNAWT